MDEITRLRSEIVALEVSIGLSSREQSPDMHREWRYERNRRQLEPEYRDRSREDDFEAMEEEVMVQEEDESCRDRRLHRPRERERERENTQERLGRFNRIRDILRKEERNRIKRMIVVKLIQRIDAVSIKQRKRFNADIRKLRYELLSISTAAENIRDGRSYYKI